MLSIKRYSFLFFIQFLFIIFIPTPTRAVNTSYDLLKNDSLRNTTKNGQRAIIYSVGSKENYYSIARKYSLTPKVLIDFNPGSKNLIVGQEILIPREYLPQTQNLRQIGPQTIIVKKGETLYSIAHAQKIPIDDLVSANALPNHSVIIGQKLIIPSRNSRSETGPNQNISAGSLNSSRINNPIAKEKDEEKPIKSNNNKSLLLLPATGLYEVGTGETIYSIGFKYGVGVEEIRTFNKLTNNDIKIGQILLLRADAKLLDDRTTLNTASPQTLEKKEAESPKNLGNHNPPESTSISRPKLPVKIIEPSNEGRRSKSIPREFKEDGMGIWVDNNDLNQAKSVALHKVAPVGTIIKVTNPMTRKSIFVKVVGSFPETEETKNAVVVISKSAAGLIGALDPHFRVELSYAY